MIEVDKPEVELSPKEGITPEGYRDIFLNIDCTPEHAPGKFAPGTEYLNWIGNVACAGGNWGKPVETEEVVGRLQEAGEDQTVLDAIANMRIPVGYHKSADTYILSDEHQAELGEYLYQTTLTLLRAKGWDKLAAFFCNSSSVTNQTLEHVANKLEVRKHCSIGNLHRIVSACSGDSFAESLAQSLYQEEQVATISLDTISGADYTDFKNPFTWIVFGTGAAGKLYRPLIDMSEEDTSAVYDPDLDGHFQVAPYVNDMLSDENKPSKLLIPEFLRMEPGAQEHIRATDRTFQVLFYSSEEGFSMDGRRVAHDFSNSESGEMIVDVLRKGSSIDGINGHQPSYAVVSGLNKHILLAYLAQLNVDRKAARVLMRDEKKLHSFLKTEGIDIDTIQMPWVLDKLGFNNMSAPTSPMAKARVLGTQERQEEYKGSTYIDVGLGIGKTVIFKRQTYNSY